MLSRNDQEQQRQLAVDGYAIKDMNDPFPVFPISLTLTKTISWP